MRLIFNNHGKANGHEENLGVAYEKWCVWVPRVDVCGCVWMCVDVCGCV